DRIDDLVRAAEGLPLKFDEAIGNIPALVQQIPFLDCALLYSISWLECLLSVLTDLGTRVKEKEIIVVDVNYNKEGTEIPDDRTGKLQSEPATDDCKPETVQETDREFATNNGELKLAAGDDRRSQDAEHQVFMMRSNDDAKFVQDDSGTEMANNDDQTFTESRNDREVSQGTFNEATIAQENGELTRNESGGASETDPATVNGQNENDEATTDREEEQETFMVIAPENGDSELETNKPAAVLDTDPTIADDHSGNSDNQTLTADEQEADHQAFLAIDEQENGRHELTRTEPGTISDEKCESKPINLTGEETVEQEVDHQTCLTNSEETVPRENGDGELTTEEPEAVAETDLRITNERSEPEMVVPETEQPNQEGTSTRMITINNSSEEALPETDPSVTSSAIVSETDETGMEESDCSSQVKSDRDFVTKEPEKRIGIVPVAGNLVAWSNGVKGSYKDVLVKPGKEVNSQKASFKGKRHVKKVISRGNAEPSKEELITREGKGRRKGRRKKLDFI
ncbi:hypothetical protein LINGRAHAP2_LOCUS36961, partial [Linum grandiflorum]